MSKECTASLDQLRFARNQLKGMFANALATRTKDERNLVSVPTYLAWVNWKMNWRYLGGHIGRGFWREYGQWNKEGQQKRANMVAIGKHLLKPVDKWKYLVHEAMHWGPYGWSKMRSII